VEKTMNFTKMHGLGNDYIYINGFEESVADPAALAVRVSDRHFGVGGDGLVLILPAEEADVRMRMFNADGSEGMMCGNAIRCVAKYAHQRGLATMNPVRVETASGVKVIDKVVADGVVTGATVDMGEPILVPADVPVMIDGQTDAPIVDRSSEGLADLPAAVAMTCVSMGNPHVVVYCDDVDAVPLTEVGPRLETAAIFPGRINVHYVQVVGPGEVKMRTWERGSGITLACGTGASAVCVAGVLTGMSDRDVLVHLPGGDLEIEWREENNRVYMTGPATEVFDGTLDDVQE
jgi:diaminopimelate epimerase